MPPNVEVRRSARRRRTVSAYREGDKTIVLLPSSLSQAEEEYEIARILERLEGRERRRRAPEADEDLLDRAMGLSRRYLNGRARPSSVRWVDNQRSRWGSCTPDDRTIRISSMLKQMPSWVVDYVLIHELAHLLEPGHNAAFWNLVAAYPKTERARGYLEGVAAAANLGTAEDFHSGEPAEIDFGATG
ncbi:M48 family metallopeptidase [Actinocorallia longicatena]|uniref:M48 metallopeptidase family protein n=1 Tax=Actinocorallia longicatena TaxID=111803 RepID=UPI0031E259E4